MPRWLNRAVRHKHAQLERIQAYSQRLRLYQVAAELPSLLEQGAKAERSYTDFLEEVLRREVRAKTDKHWACG